MNTFLNALVVAAWLVSHPVHVTLTSIEHVQGTDSLKVYLMMYHDDFLLDYLQWKKNEENHDGVNPSEDQIVEYVNEKVRLVLNNKVLKGKLSDMSIRNNEMHLNLLYKSEKTPVTLTISNRIMTELYSDQSNLVIIKMNGSEEGFKLSPELTEHTISSGNRSNWKKKK
jgi:hypothetical protein